MLGTRGIVQGALVAALLFGVLAAVAIAIADRGDQALRGGDCPPVVKPLKASQQRILKRDAVRVKLPGHSCVGGGKIRLKALSELDGAKRRVTDTVKAPTGKKARLQLPLTGDGAARIARCVEQTLLIRATARSGASQTPEPLELDSDACRGTLPAPGPGPGDPGPPPGGGGGAIEPVESGIDSSNADRCDFLDPAHCLYPWPNDHFTAADAHTDSGRRIDLHPLSVPRNRFGVPINPLDYNRSDGFSPGQLIVTKVPGLETQAAFERTGAVPITEIERYRDAEQPIVVIDAETGERHPVWTEIDSNPQDPADVALLIRPAVNFAEGHRYVVALRDLRDESGAPIEAERGFRLYRDRIVTTDAAVEARRERFERDVFAPLAAGGIERNDLYLAWDFTVASERSISERALAIRDDAFAQLGDEDLSNLSVEGDAPSSIVTSVTDYAPAENDRIARQVEGQIAVPCYLDLPGCPPGSRFAFGPDPDDPAADPNPLHWSAPLAIPGNTTIANFICRIPRSANAAAPARPSLYGHGLLGSASEVGAGNISAMANEHNMLFCATDWAGFATTDAGTVLASLQDLSTFPRLVDRMQQGFVNFMYLGRALIHPDGLGSDPAFQIGGGDVIDERRLFYDGNSQGGIMGGALTALAPDFEHAVLGVPGMNYSTLLRRSSDFAPYAEGRFTGVVCDEVPEPFDAACGPVPEDTPLGLYDNYPDELERPLILSMIQMIWDRGEANGYAHHMTADPLANTPPHEVLLHPAVGDHQVANVTAEVEARTIGAATNPNGLDPGRDSDVTPLWNVPEIGSFPFDGSAIVYWDSGSPVAPTGNVPPHEGRDPHSHPRNDVKARQQKSAFLAIDGKVTDVCGGGPCYADGYTGP